MSTPTWPDFETTIVLRDGKPIFVRAKIEGRLCNLDYKSANYLVGQEKPNYPVPALYYNRAIVVSEEGRFAYNPRNPWWLNH